MAMTPPDADASANAEAEALTAIAEDDECTADDDNNDDVPQSQPFHHPAANTDSDILATDEDATATTHDVATEDADATTSQKAANTSTQNTFETSTGTCRRSSLPKKKQAIISSHATLDPTSTTMTTAHAETADAFPCRRSALLQNQVKSASTTTATATTATTTTTTTAAAQTNDRRSALHQKQFVSHRSFFASSKHTLQRSHGARTLFADITEEEDDSSPPPGAGGGHVSNRGGGGVSARNVGGGLVGFVAPPQDLEQPQLQQQEEEHQQPQQTPRVSLTALSLEDWRSRTRRFFSHQINDNSNHPNPNLSDLPQQHEQQEEEGKEDVLAPQSAAQSQSRQQLPPPPDSEVERIVQRLEHRNANRVPVPFEVKSRFLRLCKNACRKRRRILEHSMLEQSTTIMGSYIHGMDGMDNSNRSTQNNTNIHSSININNNSTTTTTHDNNNGSSVSNNSHHCILRTDIIQIRTTIRLEVENRTRSLRIADGIKSHLGFKCHSKVLLNVLNRAVDLIDETSGIVGVGMEGKKERHERELRSRAGSTSLPSFGGLNGAARESISDARELTSSSIDNGSFSPTTLDSPTPKENAEGTTTLLFDEAHENEWFYYKDFAFYSLKIESNYPWMRNAGVFSILLTIGFYVFTPILWCSVLNDPNICAVSSQGNGGGGIDGTNDGTTTRDGGNWLSALFFASATMSTVGYGDITVFVGSEDPDVPNPETWRIFLAILFMILSLIVSVVGFQAGLDSQFHPFRRRLDIFGRRVYEILRDANVVKGKEDKHDEIISRMRWSKFSQLAEIILIFMMLNLVGVFAVQLSLLGEKEDEFGDTLSISWMESFYWAVQTTTTIGYGDVTTPESLRWFLLLYLAISTYFVGSAFGKLGELSKKLESMQRLYLWQQQEASYTMLHDFSGRPDSRDEKNADNDEEGKEIVDFEPEIDQFEFTIASLVVMGKITSEDVRPILEKFKRLTGENSNKITSSDVSGPMRKKKTDLPESDEGGDKQEKSGTEPSSSDAGGSNNNEIFASSMKSSGSGALGVGKKIARAFREEILSSSVSHTNQVEFEDFEEEKEDYSDFRIPKNTYAIAIDDSKIQRKLLTRIFDHAGITSDRCTVCGDGYDEIMGFEDYVVKFIQSHDGYVFMIVDENLDVVDETSPIKQSETISGSICVENIRRRLPPESERRMFALIRSANDSSSDIAIYNTRAHGFLPKAPIKRDKMNETLAPLWRGRFPPSEFGESIGIQNELVGKTSADDIACTPYDIAQKLIDIEALFQKNAHETEQHLINDEMHELKGDLLTLNSNVTVHSVVGQINLIQVTKAPETLVERWNTLRQHINDIIQSLQKNFRIPKNTYAIAIDDSKIQRKLLNKFFEFLSIPPENRTIVGDGYSEIKGFEDLVINFMQDHKDDYVFMVVDENLDANCEGESVSVSGSQCVDNIRQRLPAELERRMLILVRSANDSTTDVAIFNKRAHGFLPKAPIRREKVNETLAPLWMKRFPPSEFGDSAAGFDISDETVSIASDDVACTPYDIAQKLIDIESLFKKEAHFTDVRIIHDQLHELKGDLLTLNSGASMISILGMINLMLLGHKQTPEVIVDKWHALRDRIYAVINALQGSTHVTEGQSATTVPKIKMFEVLRSKSKDVPTSESLASSFTRMASSSNDSPLARSFTRRASLSNSAVSAFSSKLSEDSDPVKKYLPIARSK